MATRWKNSRSDKASSTSTWGRVKRIAKQVTREVPKVIHKTADLAESVGEAVEESLEATESVIGFLDSIRDVKSAPDVTEVLHKGTGVVGEIREAVSASEQVVEEAEDLASYSRKKLDSIAKKRGLKGFSTMSKPQLIEALKR